MPDMSVNKCIRDPLWATLVGALVAAMVVSFVVFVQSGEAAPQAADEQTPYASVSPRSPMIVGGTAVPDGKYPFMAYLELYGKGKSVWACGGTLIDRDSVLTAAHCLKNTTGAVVAVGRTDLREKNRGQVIEASRPFIHPRYNRNGYDAAVLKLSRSVKGIKPIKLATAKQNDLEKPGHILTAAGWGVMKQRKVRPDISPKRMREVSVPVVSDSRAKRAYQSQGLKYLPSLDVAAGKKGKSACFGDSGGPLFDSGSRTQVGITSHGAPGGCGRARYPAVYTEVNNPEIRDFILAAAKR
jgi:secreted trypsin-like serine protease